MKLRKSTIAMSIALFIAFTFVVSSPFIFLKKEDDTIYNNECIYSGELPEHLWQYMNRVWASQDRNLYVVECAYDGYPEETRLDGGNLRKIRYYIVHLIGSDSYASIPCYNDNFCSDPILPGLLIYDKDEENSLNATEYPTPIRIPTETN